MSESNERGGFSFQLSETPPPTRSEERAPLDDLVLDLQDFGTWEEPVAPGNALSPSAEPVPEAPKPRIKKIEFPLKKPAASAAATVAPGTAPLKSAEPTRTSLNSSTPKSVESKSTAPKTSKKPKTRFSDSISAPAVTARLVDEGDSEPPPAMNRSEGEGDLAVPDDLPAFHSSENQATNDAWGSETPTAKEIWNSARRKWKTTTRHAAVLGEKSLRAGQKAAQGINAKIKEHRETSSKEREARAAFEATSRNSAAAIGGPLPSNAPVNSTPSPSREPLFRVPSLQKQSLKKIAAPLSAVAAASLVYLGGTQLLGTQEGVSLSRSAQAPDVPELGSLKSDETTNKSSPEVRDQRGEAAEKSKSDSKPPTDGLMKAEVAPMPDGLSWPGKGLIEVVTSEEELIYVDGVFTGRGPLRRIPVSPGEHEVSIRTGGSKRSGTVQVEVNKNTRAVFTSE